MNASVWKNILNTQFVVLNIGVRDIFSFFWIF